MTSTGSARLRTTLASAAVGALLIAGCAPGDDEPTASPGVVGETPTDEAPATPEDAGTSRVDSLDGTLSAEIPNAWEAYPEETAEQAFTDPLVTDVLGLWTAGMTTNNPHSIVIIGQEQEDPALDAEEYYETYFDVGDDLNIEIIQEIFTSEEGHEVLFVDLVAAVEGGVAEESVFFVFGDDDIVVGLISAPAMMDRGIRDAMRAVADSLTIDT